MINPEKRYPTTVRLPGHLVAQLDVVAHRMGYSRAAVIETMLEMAMQPMIRLGIIRGSLAELGARLGIDTPPDMKPHGGARGR